MKNNQALKAELLELLESIRKDILNIEDLGSIKPEVFSSIFKSTADINRLLHQTELDRFQDLNLEMAELLKRISLFKVSLNGNPDSILEEPQLSESENPFIVKEENSYFSGDQKKSIRSLMSLNDYFRLQRELFDGNDEAVKHFISLIDQAPSANAAKAILKEKFGNKEENEILVELIRMIDLSFV